MAILNLKTFGAVGNGLVDDTAAIVSCFTYAGSLANAAVEIPTGPFLISDGTAGYQNQQILEIIGGGTSFTITVTIAGISLTTSSISYSSSAGQGPTNAGNIQTALGALPGIGVGNVTVTYQTDSGWYGVLFAPQMGQPGLAASGSSLTFVLMKGNPNQQAVQIAGSYNQSFTLTVTIGKPPSLGGGATTLTTSAINYATTTTQTASNIQNALATLSNVGGSGNVACVYDPSYGFVVTFNPSLGAPVMTASSANLTVSITVLQSGAAIVIPNLFGLRIFGHGNALADYNQPQSGAPSSRSAFVWTGTANGIMLALPGCNDVTIENLALWGATVATANNKARTGLLFSSNPRNAAGQQGGSRLTCRSMVSTQFFNSLASTDPNYGANPSGCVQLGMNASDSGGDTTVHNGCTWANGSNGLLVVSAASVNHSLQGVAVGTLNNGAWFIQGGNLLWDGCKAEALSVTIGGSTFGGTVLKVGPTSLGTLGGGPNAATFLLRNVRTNPLTGPNITVADMSTAAAGTQATVEGWDDSAASQTDITTPGVIVGQGSGVNIRHSLVNRTPLAVEGSTNAPTAAITAALRLENVVVPEGQVAGGLCPGLSVNTKVDNAAERTATYNVVRPDVSTMAGRPRYSPGSRPSTGSLT